MKRTHKLRTLAGDVDAVLAAAPNLSAAARTLGVDRSTLTRWFQKGKVTKPARGGLRRLAETAPDTARDTETESTLAAAPATDDAGPTMTTTWGAGIVAAYDLSPTERVVVAMADDAWRLAHDPTVKPEVRLTAMSKFLALERRLNLEEPAKDGPTETTTDVGRKYPRAVGA